MRKGLTASELKEFKKLLIKAKEKVMGQLDHVAKDTLNKSQKDAAGDLSAYTFHMADVATDSFDRDMSLDIASGEQQVIFRVDEALKRIEDKTYGLCLDCDAKIPKGRLKVVPYADLCIKCQTKKEKK